MMVKLFGTLEIGGTGQQVAVVDESGRNVSNSVNNPASQRRNRCVENVQDETARQICYDLKRAEYAKDIFALAEMVFFASVYGVALANPEHPCALL